MKRYSNRDANQRSQTSFYCKVSAFRTRMQPASIVIVLPPRLRIMDVSFQVQMVALVIVRFPLISCFYCSCMVTSGDSPGRKVCAICMAVWIISETVQLWRQWFSLSNFSVYICLFLSRT